MKMEKRVCISVKLVHAASGNSGKSAEFTSPQGSYVLNVLVRVKINI